MSRAVIALLLLGCGSSNATTAASKSPPPVTAADDDDEVPEPMKATATAEPKGHDVHEDGSVIFENLFKAGAAGFPKAVTSDAECSKGVGYTGSSAKDYSELTDKCGTGTGMKEFVTRHAGKLDEKHPSETYAFKMLGGFCYRFFAVADDTVKGIKIRVQRPGGALLSIAASKSFVTMMNPDSVWCKKKDREFRLVVESGGGQGSYTFGIWARPK